MNIEYLVPFIVYFSIIGIVGLIFYYKQKNATDFMVGNRSLNYWVTAIAAHATDMTTWLFMGFPGLVYREGIFASWMAIGLTIGMYLTWTFIAPRLRIATEQTNTMTLPSFFESRFHDPAGHVRLVSALIALSFFTLYIAAGIVGIGQTIELVFGINYYTGITVGTLVVSFYVLLGGFFAVAWNDFLQGLFVLCILLIVPFFAAAKAGGPVAIWEHLRLQNVNLSLFPDYSLKTFISVISLSIGWGLGYFGSPHILINFMGIKNVNDMKKARTVGIAWQIMCLTSVILIALIGIAFFAHDGLGHSEHVFIVMATRIFPPTIAGFMLCGILAAAITTIDTQILVSASTIAEDIYKKFFNKNISNRGLLHISRLGGLLITGISFWIAFYNTKSILDLVSQAWAGLGGAFGPIIVATFIFPYKINKWGALTGIITGGIIGGTWQLWGYTPLYPLIPAFIGGLIAIYATTWLTHRRYNVNS